MFRDCQASGGDISVEEGASRRYIVVTPCKNEGENLPDLIASVVAQTVKPVVWVIVDDGSMDDTSNIVEDAMKAHNWIQSIQLNSNVRDIGPHLADVMKKGFDLAISYCTRYEIEYNYLGNLDGDLTLPHTFYENLIKEFENDPKLGVASGGTKHIIGNRVRHAKVAVNEPSGGHMLMRRECFEMCGGIPRTYSMDSVMKVKARLEGWETRRFEENIATEIRDVNAADGYWNGFVHNGRSSYYLNINPLHVMARAIIYSLRRPYYAGVAYLIGYLGSLIRGRDRIPDQEVRTYYWNKWREYL